MTGSERRDQIINQIKKSSIPVSGAQLAKEFDRTDPGSGT